MNRKEEKTVTLTDLKLKKSYDSDSDNIIEGFYIPALSNSSSYKRLTGFFSSTCLAVAAKGISRYTFHPVMHQHSVVLPIGLEYSNPSFKIFTLPNLPLGTYTGMQHS